LLAERRGAAADGSEMKTSLCVRGEVERSEGEGASQRI
jgi:hypothetical protein